MKRTIAAVLLAVVAVPGWGQPAPAQPPAAPPQALIDLSLVQALVAVDAQDLTGVFGYMPEAAVAPAFADYLNRNVAAFKRFQKMARADIKETGGINAWDRTVFLYLMQLDEAPVLPPGLRRLSKKEEFEVSGFILARPLTFSEMAAARGARR